MSMSGWLRLPLVDNNLLKSSRFLLISTDTRRSSIYVCVHTTIYRIFFQEAGTLYDACLTQSPELKMFPPGLVPIIIAYATREDGTMEKICTVGAAWINGMVVDPHTGHLVCAVNDTAADLVKVNPVSGEYEIWVKSVGHNIDSTMLTIDERDGSVVVAAYGYMECTSPGTRLLRISEDGKLSACADTRCDLEFENKRAPYISDFALDYSKKDHPQVYAHCLNYQGEHSVRTFPLPDDSAATFVSKRVVSVPTRQSNMSLSVYSSILCVCMTNYILLKNLITGKEHMLPIPCAISEPPRVAFIASLSPSLFGYLFMVHQPLGLTYYPIPKDFFLSEPSTDASCPAKKIRRIE